MNENYHHPAMPEGAEQDILKGMYLFRKGGASKKAPRVSLLGSGTIYMEVIAAADMLKDDWGVEADLWSCPSFNQLAREGNGCERWNRLHPTETARVAHVAQCLPDAKVPVIASTDYIRAFAEPIRGFISAPYTVLGTDGFGRSDTRENLRRFFEVDRYHVTVAALKSLADMGSIDAGKVAEAIAKYGIDTELDEPRLR
jgi:pyruvate dehydrogenase E1 component